MGTSQQLQLSRIGHQIVFRAEGRCSAKLAEAISHFIQLVPTGADDDLYFDLAQCDALESTFAGLLVNLVKRANSHVGPSIHLLSPSEPIMTSLRQMGLARMLDVRQALPVAAEHWKALPVDDVNPDELADLIIEAHEALIAADPRNEAAYRKVVACFKTAKDATNPPTDHN